MDQAIVILSLAVMYLLGLFVSILGIQNQSKYFLIVGYFVQLAFSVMLTVYIMTTYFGAVV